MRREYLGQLLPTGLRFISGELSEPALANMSHALIGLGSNLGDRQWLLERAALLGASTGIAEVKPSQWYATQAIGGPAGQPDFLNGAVLVETSLPPRELHQQLREIEFALGRVRGDCWGPRTIDLDLCLLTTSSLKNRI